ncbi:MAG: hypothetical protein ACI867_000906, partial [Glaciecola sp.]
MDTGRLGLAKSDFGSALLLAALSVGATQRDVPDPADEPFVDMQWHHAMVNTPAARKITRGEGVTVAMIDSRIHPDHPDRIQKPNSTEPGTDPSLYRTQC